MESEEKTNDETEEKHYSPSEPIVEEVSIVVYIL